MATYVLNPGNEEGPTVSILYRAGTDESSDPAVEVDRDDGSPLERVSS
jgi:hypothetical protein